MQIDRWKGDSVNKRQRIIALRRKNATERGQFGGQVVSRCLGQQFDIAVASFGCVTRPLSPREMLESQLRYRNPK
jgi:hypothetical protein